MMALLERVTPMIAGASPAGLTARCPRLDLAYLPTRAERMRRLGAMLGLASLRVKRDGCRGLGAGGNKAGSWNSTWRPPCRRGPIASSAAVSCSRTPHGRSPRPAPAWGSDAISASCMAGLIGLARQGRFARGETVLWIQAGGLPGVFAYPETMARLAARAGWRAGAGGLGALRGRPADAVGVRHDPAPPDRAPRLPVIPARPVSSARPQEAARAGRQRVAEGVAISPPEPGRRSRPNRARA